MDRLVKNSNGYELDFVAAVNFMVDDIREDIYSELSPCKDQEFFTAYEKVHNERFD